MLKDRMEEIYRTTRPEDIPWNVETPPPILKNLVETGKIRPCRALELGCGAGNYVIYLAKEGFDATGVDFSETAIEMARSAAESKGVECHFLAADVLGGLDGIQGNFDFIYDWGLLHHIFPESRRKYLEKVRELLTPEGLYLSLYFAEESPQFGGAGKYRKTHLDTELYFSSEREMEELYAPFFQIENMETVDIEGKIGLHRAICALLTPKPR